VPKFALAGILPTDSEEVRLQKSLLIFATGLISLASMLWLFIYWQLGPQISSTIPFVFQILLVANLVIYMKTLNFEVFRQIQLSLFLFVPFVAQWSMGNFITASGISLWALLAPIGACSSSARMRRWRGSLLTSSSPRCRDSSTITSPMH
jgi:adenylate cyclase